MADLNEKFSHIVVDQEDDLVIEAGSVVSPQNSAPTPDFQNDNPVAQEDSQRQPYVAPEPVESSRQDRDEFGYETTEEDLKPGPMPLAQKLTLAAVAIILAIAIFYIGVIL